MNSEKNESLGENFVKTDEYFVLDESKEIIYTDYTNEKIIDVNGNEITQEELINSIDEAENGKFYTIEEMRERFEKWKAEKFGDKK
jgi:hypothetical protein